ncbi:MAG: hypothetical protein DMF58_10265, partial [Acidobacteria bacterium]
MIRKTLAPLFLLVAVTAVAQNRGHAVTVPFPFPGTTVSGVVTAVNGTNVSLANGLVIVDVSQATITDDRGNQATITPGSLIFVILRSSTSLQASTVIVTNIPQVTLSGPVQSVNAAAGTLQVLGLTIHTNSSTSIGGSHGIHGLSDIVANDVVQIQADAVGSTLVASSILVFAPAPQPLPTLLHGTVKSIGTDSHSTRERANENSRLAEDRRHGRCAGEYRFRPQLRRNLDCRFATTADSDSSVRCRQIDRRDIMGDRSRRRPRTRFSRAGQHANSNHRQSESRRSRRCHRATDVGRVRCDLDHEAMKTLVTWVIVIAIIVLVWTKGI